MIKGDKIICINNGRLGSGNPRLDLIVGKIYTNHH